jgi:hypothetical protein
MAGWSDSVMQCYNHLQPAHIITYLSAYSIIQYNFKIYSDLRVSATAHLCGTELWNGRSQVKIQWLLIREPNRKNVRPIIGKLSQNFGRKVQIRWLTCWSTCSLLMAILRVFLMFGPWMICRHVQNLSAPQADSRLAINIVNAWVTRNSFTSIYRYHLVMTNIAMENHHF